MKPNYNLNRCHKKEIIFHKPIRLCYVRVQWIKGTLLVKTMDKIYVMQTNENDEYAPI